jgi:integrase
MATLQKKGNGWYCQFLYHGKRHTFTVGRVSKAEARSKANQVGYLLMRLKQRLADLPPGVDIVEFVQRDGNPIASPTAPAQNGELTLAKFRDRYLATNLESQEKRSIEGIELHFKHLAAALGDRFPIRELKMSHLQEYINRRAKAKGMYGRRLSPATIKKEIVTLRTAWNWAVEMGLVAGRFPNKNLRYPKLDEKPPFMTREEIERQIAAGGLSEAQTKDLWNALFLTLPEVSELLDHVREAGTLPWVYPMVCFAAHTGARRSELLRARLADVDFNGKAVLIHEKKRVRGKRTTRRVPLSPFLTGVLKEWLDSHPGGQYLFCNTAVVARSKKRSRMTGYKGDKSRASTTSGRLADVKDREGHGVGAITEDEAHDHLRRSLKAGRWSVVRGWHIARHSFASNCAAKGIDQRLIDRWLGHTTDEMRRRYQHLIPNQEQQAIGSVFG